MKNPLWVKRHKILLLFVLCFSLPFFAAKLALAFSWYTPGILAKGEWLDREVKFPVSSNAVWRLVYVVPAPCENSCQFAIHALHQIYSGLGKYQSRVEADLVSSQPPDFSLSDEHGLLWLMPPINGEAALDNEILILNPQGVALLRYKIATNSNDENAQQNAPELAKAIRTDLLRLLNYDRVAVR